MTKKENQLVRLARLQGSIENQGNHMLIRVLAKRRTNKRIV